MHRKLQILQLASPDSGNSAKPLGHSCITSVRAILYLRRDAVAPPLACHEPASSAEQTCLPSSHLCNKNQVTAAVIEDLNPCGYGLPDGFPF